MTVSDISLETAKNYARQRAVFDAPDDLCSRCVAATPLDYPTPSVATIQFVDGIVDDVHPDVVAKHGELVINSVLRQAYREAFWQHTAEPSDCISCTTRAAPDGADCTP